MSKLISERCRELGYVSSEIFNGWTCLCIKCRWCFKSPDRTARYCSACWSKMRRYA